MVIDINDLIEAIEDRDLDQAESILAREPRLLNLHDSTGFAPIHSAVHHGDLEMVNYLVSLQCDLSVVEDGDGSTPLHFAAAEGRLTIANMLLQHRAGVDATNRDGKTPLFLAAEGAYRFRNSRKYDDRYQYEQVVNSLRQHGAVVDANSAIYLQDNARLFEVIDGDPSLIENVLSKRDLLIDAVTTENESAIERLLEVGLTPCVVSLFRAIDACEGNDDGVADRLRILRLILEAGAGEYLHQTDPFERSGTPYARSVTLAKQDPSRVPEGFMELIESHNSLENGN